MRNILVTLRRTLRLLGSDRRWRWLLLVGLALAMAGFEAVGALLILALLQLAVTSGEQPVVPVLGDLAAIFPGADRDTILLGTAAVALVFFVARGSLLVGQAYIQARMVHNAAARLSAHLVRGYLAMPYLFHTKQNSATLVRNTFDSVTVLISQIMVPLVRVVSQSILVIGLIVVLLWASASATLLAVAVFGPLIWLLLRIIHPRLKRLGRHAQEAKEGSLQAVQQALGGVRDIKVLAKEPYFARVFARQRQALSRASYLHSAVLEGPRSLIETTLALIIVLLFALAVIAGNSVEGLVSTLGVFAYVGMRLQPSLREIAKGLNDLKFGTAVLDDLSADRQQVDAALEVDRMRRAAPAAAHDFADRVELRQVTFSYSPEAPPALANIDLTIRKGEFIGICGPTGGGKSTLVDLVVGLLTPTGGQILVDGRPLDDVTTWWQRQLGVVSQSVFLVDDTVRRNIALGEDDEIDEDRLARAVERAQLELVVADLPDGLDTVVGERGIRLSGGQRQRVAIARAFYREPAVLILDEGTSALDAATEAALVAAVDQLKQGRTLIAVAHRISTVRRADRIVVVEGGRIAADGTHDDLLKDNHLFRTLAQ